MRNINARKVMLTYPLFKCPALADFVFIVVEYLLPSLDHFVPHVLDLRHSLKGETYRPDQSHREEENNLSRLMSSYTKGLRHHDFDRNKRVVVSRTVRYAHPVNQLWTEPWCWVRGRCHSSRSRPTFSPCPLLEANPDPQLGC